MTAETHDKIFSKIFRIIFSTEKICEIFEKSSKILIFGYNLIIICKNLVIPQQCVKNSKFSIKMKKRQSFHRYNFPKNQFYDIRSSQRQPASVRVKFLAFLIFFQDAFLMMNSFPFSSVQFSIDRVKITCKATFSDTVIWKLY